MHRRQAVSGLVAVVAMVSWQITLGGTPADAATEPGLPAVGPVLAAMARHQPAPAARAAITATANDVTGDGIDDVLTRDRATGRLDVHAGRGALAGSATPAAPVQVRATTPDRV